MNLPFFITIHVGPNHCRRGTRAKAVSSNACDGTASRSGMLALRTVHFDSASTILSSFCASGDRALNYLLSFCALQGWGLPSKSHQPFSPWANHMVFGLHPIYRRVKANFGEPKTFKRVLRIMKEWGHGLDVPIYNAPELPRMLEALHTTFHS